MKLYIYKNFSLKMKIAIKIFRNIKIHF